MGYTQGLETNIEVASRPYRRSTNHFHFEMASAPISVRKPAVFLVTGVLSRTVCGSQAPPSLSLPLELTPRFGTRSDHHTTLPDARYSIARSWHSAPGKSPLRSLMLQAPWHCPSPGNLACTRKAERQKGETERGIMHHLLLTQHELEIGCHAHRLSGADGSLRHGPKEEHWGSQKSVQIAALPHFDSLAPKVCFVQSQRAPQFPRPCTQNITDLANVHNYQPQKSR